jgi:hypothetical protein
VRRRFLPLILLVACGRAEPASPEAPLVTPAPDPLDPGTCAACHADHVRAWSGSMHAYATDDPVFVAMNARGQRETNGALGDFCLKCHAPLANGRDPATLPKALRGVTCAFCHGIAEVMDTHDGALRLAGDGAMRGPIASPIESSFHASTYSPLHDRARLESASLCGACHDVRNPAGVDIEHTFAEWQTTPYATPSPDGQKTCANCHMPETHAPAATVPGAPVRPVHDHTMAALDTALIPFAPDQMAAQDTAAQTLLDAALSAKLCVSAPGAITATLDNARIGHAWPTGAAQNRRAWLDVVAYASGSVVWSSDPSASSLSETLLDAHADPTRFLWQAVATRSTVLDPGASRTFTFVAPPQTDRVTMRVRVTPLAPEIADDLVASGDLDPAVRARIPTRTLQSTVLEWTADRGWACLP